MNEETLNKLIQFQKTVANEFNDLAGFIKSEDFAKVDGLNKDLAVTEANTLQTLLGLISIRIGLNISSVRQQESTDVEQLKEEANEQENPAEKTDESEQ